MGIDEREKGKDTGMTREEERFSGEIRKVAERENPFWDSYWKEETRESSGNASRTREGT